MPVRKFRDVSEIPPPAKLDPVGPQLWERIADWMALSARLSPNRWPPGIYKNRTIEEANRRRQSWRPAR